MDRLFNTPDFNIEVDGKKWFPRRKIKDIDGNLVYKIPFSSFFWNNSIFVLRALFELIKVLAGSAVLVAIIKVLPLLLAI